MELRSKGEAQKRTDQIRSFQAELAMVEKENVLLLSDAQRTALASYHNNLLANLVSRFDIDVSTSEKQLSLGMKIASFLGALGLAASIFFLFYQFWGKFPTAAQVGILICAPLVSLAATMFISGREKTGYFVKIFAMVTVACFVLNLSLLGTIFNITPSENVFFVWSVFAFLLAYASDARLLLAMGILFFAAYLSAKVGVWSGCYWFSFGERPENFFPVACLLFFISLLPHDKFSDFTPLYRVFSLLFLFIPVLILSNWGEISYFYLPSDNIEICYQIVGFLFSAGAIWLGIKKNWPEVMHTGDVFFVIFFYTKMFDWWWDLMPKYIFFFVLGMTAILVLFLLKKFRDMLAQNERGERR